MNLRLRLTSCLLLSMCLTPATLASELSNDFQNVKRAQSVGFAGPVTPAWEFLPAFVGGGFGRLVASPQGVVYAHGINSDPFLYAVSAEGQELWRYDTHASHFPSIGPAIGPDGTVYSVSGDGVLHAITADGTVKWLAQTQIGGAEVRITPAGRIVVTSPTGMQVFDENGSEVVTRIVSGFFLTPWFRSQPAFSPDGQTYYAEVVRRHPNGVFGLTESTLEARSVDTQELLWQVAGLEGVLEEPQLLLGWGRSPATDALGNIYSYGCLPVEGILTGCALRSFDPSGQLRWQAATNRYVSVTFGGVTPDNQTIIVNCDIDGGGGVCAPELGVVSGFDTANGTARWRVFEEPLGLRRPLDGLVDNAGMPYAFLAGAGLQIGVVRIDPTVPEEQWVVAPVPFTGWETMTIAPKRRLYTSGARIHAFDQAGFVPNALPIANAGLDQSTLVGRSVHLDGTGSSDADNDALSYVWTIVDGPTLDAGQLTESDQPVSRLTPAAEGTYTVSLVVNDGIVNSQPDMLSVRVSTRLQCAAESTNQLLALVSGSHAAEFDTPGHQVALSEFAAQALGAVELGNLDHATLKYKEILRRTDGCLIRGTPDPSRYERDWITGCGTAAAVHRLAHQSLSCITNHAADAPR